MSLSASPVTIEERERYPIHEEDDVPEKPPHECQNSYLRPALRAHLPGAFVTGNVCIYWEPEIYEEYAAPDLMVVLDWQPTEVPSVYLTWADPPIAFVAEIFAPGQTIPHERKKENEYATLVRAREYLSYHQGRRELRLRRLGPDGYEEVAPGPNGRLRSEELRLEFEADREGFVWAYTLEGERLQSYEELDQRVEELDQRVTDEARRRAMAETRAASEARRREAAERQVAGEARQRQEAEARVMAEARQRQEAEVRVVEEARQRQQAEARVAEEAQQRQEAEERAVEEAQRRQEAEAQAAEERARREELEREIAALRAQIEQREV